MLRVRGLGLHLADGTALLSGVDLDVGPGEVVAVLGDSGAGKSSLLWALLGFLPRGARLVGEASLHTTDLLTRPPGGRGLGVLPQHARSSLDPLRTVHAQVTEAATVHGLPPPSDTTWDRVHLDPALARRPPHTLSGGQQQRAALALALASEPALLLADEPTAALDTATARAVLDTLVAVVRAEGRGLLLVSHDPVAAARVADRWLVLHRGCVVAAGPPDEVLRDPHPAVARLRPPTAPARLGGPTAPPLLHASKLTARRGPTLALTDVDLDLRPGELLAVVGPSGGGKTTLLRSLLRLPPPDTGRATLDGVDLTALDRHDAAARQLRRRLQPVFQDATASLDPRHTVRRLLALPRAAHGLPADDAALTGLLTAVGLDANLLSRTAPTLSGGQAQRVAVARALGLEPQLLLADEPASALDPDTGHRIHALLRDLTDRHGLGVLLVTHAVAEALLWADRLLVLIDGQVAVQGSPADVRCHPWVRSALDA